MFVVFVGRVGVVVDLDQRCFIFSEKKYRMIVGLEQYPLNGREMDVAQYS